MAFDWGVMKSVVSLLVLLFALAAVMPAQIANEGAVLGVVMDPTGAAIVGAQVTVENLDTRFTKTVTTDGAGSFEILALPIGPYSVTISLQGLRT